MQQNMHLYSCDDCVMVFAVEAHEDIDHSQIVCPVCESDVEIRDVGYGYFTVTEPAEVTS